MFKKVNKPLLSFCIAFLIMALFNTNKAQQSCQFSFLPEIATDKYKKEIINLEEGDKRIQYWDTSSVPGQFIDVGMDYYNKEGVWVYKCRKDSTLEFTYICQYNNDGTINRIDFGNPKLFNVQLYYDHGKLVQVINYSEIGTKHGWSIEYNDAGEIVEKTYYVNGEPVKEKNKE